MLRSLVGASAVAALSLLAVAACVGSGAREPSVEPEGSAKNLKTQALATSAAAIQTDAPTDALNIYLVGFHPMKADVNHQFEAHHFCRQVNQDFMQCALFDGNTPAANLHGVEYIISETLFEALPPQEKQYWHPHNGEILSGQLAAPGLPAVAEKELMRSKMNSYGKTWHTWNTGQGGMAGDALPLGEPKLAWSFNRLGEADPALIEARDSRMSIDTQERSRERQDLVPLAHPQQGVDVLKNSFGRPTQPIPGVVDTRTAAVDQAPAAPSR